MADVSEPRSSLLRSLNLSRRRFLAGLSAGSMVLAGQVSGGSWTVVTDEGTSEDAAFDPDLFVSISPDGTVTILAHRSEMGTGIRTGLPRVLADELEADWERVEIQQAIGDARLGSQNTDGSNSIRHFFERMRVAGATARTLLEAAAARKWGVDVSECRARNHQVIHDGTRRELGYGELVATARELKVPAADTLKFKPRSEWRYIGRSAPITDMKDILSGKAVYGIDARMEGQLYAVIARPPVFGGRVRSFDDTAARTVPGVSDVVPLNGFSGAPAFQPLGGIAVCADSTWAAIQGRDALQIDWDHGVNVEYDSESFAETLASSAGESGNIARDNGDAAAVIADSDDVVTAEYALPHLSHAPMETTCAVADVAVGEDGSVTSCTITAATQNPQAVQQAVAPAVGLNIEDVVVNVTLLGAGFGRKSKPDYCVEAALLSKQLRRPVHVTWTREDDIQNDYFHTQSHIHVEAVTDDDGLPKAWLQRVAYPSIGSLFNPFAMAPASFEMEMGVQDLPYQIPNIRIESGNAKAHTRIGWLRSVAHIQQNFAVSSFADELAHRAGRDPLEFLLALLGEDRHVDLKAAGLSNRGASPAEFPYDIGRLKAVTRRVAELSNWSANRDLPRGRGFGIACCRAFLGYTAHVIEVAVSRDGQLQIPNVWCVLDAGTIVSPDRVHAQVEGAAIMATTQAVMGKITFAKGRPQQANFDGYQIARMADAPRHIHVEVVDSEAAPAGVGETTVPSFAPALCNAVFHATGRRIRRLPLIDHDLSWA